MLEKAEKDSKTVTVILFHMFKKPSSDMDDDDVCVCVYGSV